MRRWVLLVVLVAALVASALGVVHSRHSSRVMFAELQTLEHEGDELSVEWGRLQLERAALAEGSRIERRATTELGLEVPQDQNVVVVP